MLINLNIEFENFKGKACVGSFLGLAGGSVGAEIRVFEL